MSKILVILGAGASADLWNSGTPDPDPRWKPPLAKELFDTNRPHYWEIARRYPACNFLLQQLALKSQSHDFDLEQQLREYAQSPSKQIRRGFHDIPRYVWDLIATVSQNYIETPTNLLNLLTELTINHENEVGIVTLNYDDFLEQALTWLPHSRKISSFQSYIADSPYIYKIHGSIDWFVRVGAPRENLNSILDQGNERILTEDRIFSRSCIKKKTGRNALTDNRDVPLYPLLTAPLANKGPMDLVCPENHIDHLRSFVADCTRFLIIGTSGRDADLLSLLHESIREQAKLIHFVVSGGSEEPEKNDVCIRFTDSIKQFYKLRSRVFVNGFAKYIRSNSIQEIAMPC